MKKIKAFLSATLLLIATLSSTSCSNAQSATEQPAPTPTPIVAAFAKGADTGWLPQMEATGYHFLDADGTQKDCLQLLKDRGINTIRLRVWVNPSTDKINGHCSKAETVALAVRAKNMGMRIMIDFHYSDSWADPSKGSSPCNSRIMPRCFICGSANARSIVLIGPHGIPRRRNSFTRSSAL